MYVRLLCKELRLTTFAGFSDQNRLSVDSVLVGGLSFAPVNLFCETATMCYTPTSVKYAYAEKSENWKISALSILPRSLPCICSNIQLIIKSSDNLFHRHVTRIQRSLFYCIRRDTEENLMRLGFVYVVE
jgi:hypothetical protein